MKKHTAPYLFVFSFIAILSCENLNDVQPNSASSEKEILAFSLSKYLIEADIVEEQQLIGFSVPAKVDLHEVRPTISISPGAKVNPPSLFPVDLSDPFTYTVTAEDESQIIYSVITEQYNDTALLIIDVQNGWAFKTLNCDSIFKNINQMAERARAAQVPVIYVFDYSDRNVANFSEWDLEIVEAIKPQKGDLVVSKKDVMDVLDKSARVEEALQSLHIGYVVLCGMTSGACVNATCLGALQRGYGVIVASDCHSMDTVKYLYKVAPSEMIKEFNSRWEDLGAEILPSSDIHF